jgi:hypothetical protein
LRWCLMTGAVIRIWAAAAKPEEEEEEEEEETAAGSEEEEGETGAVGELVDRTNYTCLGLGF